MSVYAETLTAAIGLVLYGEYILQRMHYQTIWYIWLIFNVLPFFGEIGLLVVNFIYNRKYDRVHE